MATVPTPYPEARSRANQIFVVDYEFAEANGELGASRAVHTLPQVLEEFRSLTMLIDSCSERRQVAKLIARGAQEGELCCGQRIFHCFGSLTSGDATLVWL